MPGSRLGEAVSLLRQGASLEIHFGTHSLATMAELAETIERSIYAAGSLTAHADRLTFALSNPPLRVGAFSAADVFVEGAAVDRARVRVRTAGGSSIVRLSSVTAATPLELRAGSRTEWELDGVIRVPGDWVTVRLELRSLAIPPLVWLEFREKATETTSE